MKYLKCIWFHNNGDYPVLLYSEINENRDEIRKIEIYRNGKIGYAGIGVEYGSTSLSTEPIPSIEYINNQVEFYIMRITGQEFDVVWNDSISKATK